MIEAQLPDGTTLQFPDGTDTAVVQRVVRQQLGLGGAASPQQQTGAGALGDVITSPDANAADIPQSQAPAVGPGPTLTGIRDRMQQMDMNALQALQPGPDANVPERVLRGAAQVGVHGLSTLAQLPINAMIGLGQGPGGAVTINPESGTLGLTPEAQAVAGFGANPLRFAPRINPLMRPTVGGPAPPPAGPPTSLSPNTPPPAPQAPVAGQAGSVGAAASVNAPVMAPAEAQASRATGEMQRLMTTPQPGDARVYVPGVLPTRAEIDLTPSTSLRAKTLRQEFREGFTDKEKADNETYHDFYDTRAGTPTIVQSMEREREAQAQADLRTTWGNKQDADPTPVQQVADQILASEDGRRKVVRSAVDSVTAELRDADGNLITDPQLLYGVRKHIGDMLSKEAGRETPLAQRAKASLMQLREALDTVIEDAAPGFRQYLDNFAAASKPIDVMERLQEAKLGLTNGSDRVITFGKFDRLMKDLVKERADPDATLAAKHIPDEMMGELFDMWKSLQRSASDQELAKTRGSDTAQLLGELARTGLGQAAAGALAPGIGNVALPLITGPLGRAMRQREVGRHLNPDTTPNRNSLMP